MFHHCKAKHFARHFAAQGGHPFASKCGSNNFAPPFGGFPFGGGHPFWDKFGDKFEGKFGDKFGGGFPFPNRADAAVPVNVLKKDDHIEVSVYAPGRKKENFDLKLQGKELRVRYQSAEQATETGFSWMRKEYRTGDFERIFELESGLDTENISATYTDGVLRITLPFDPNEPRKDIHIG